MASFSGLEPQAGYSPLGKENWPVVDHWTTEPWTLNHLNSHLMKVMSLSNSTAMKFSPESLLHSCLLLELDILEDSSGGWFWHWVEFSIQLVLCCGSCFTTLSYAPPTFPLSLHIWWLFQICWHSVGNLPSNSYKAIQFRCPWLHVTIFVSLLPTTVAFRLTSFSWKALHIGSAVTKCPFFWNHDHEKIEAEVINWPFDPRWVYWFCKQLHRPTDGHIHCWSTPYKGVWVI